MMHISTFELSKLLDCNIRRAHRLALTLAFERKKQGHRLIYTLEYSHPFVKSLLLIKDNRLTKPIYSLSEIASLWQWSRGLYSKERVRQLMDKFDIPIQNKTNKGYVYLIDLKKLMNE
jgi:hypothetical protein